MKQIMKSIVMSAAILVPQFASADTTAFVGVNVVPMDSSRVLQDQTVVVEDRIIVGLGPIGETKIPDGAEIVDGQNRFLMPGLADMHMHLENTSNYNDPEQLLFFLAQGTTTIRALGAAPEALAWRDGVASGDLVGPNVLLMAPTIIGNFNNSIGLKPVLLGLNIARLLLPALVGFLVLVAFRRTRARRTLLVGTGICLLIGIGLVVTETPPLNVANRFFDAPQAHVFEDRAGPVESAIAAYGMQGFDGIKLYEGLNEAQFLRGASAAAENRLYSTGHLTNQVSLEAQLASGLREVAHVDEFLSYHWIGYNLGVDPDPAHAAKRDFPVDLASIPQTAALVARNGVAVVSNMSTDEALYRLLFDLEGTLAKPEFAEYRPDLVRAWKTHGRHLSVFLGQGPYRKDTIQPFLAKLTKALHDAGVLVLIGTDSGSFQPEGSIPRDIHRELELLVEAGLSNFDALAAGTKNAGEAISRMGRGENIGTIAVGQRADMLLLRANPLEDVGATLQRDGVMANGVWFEQSELDAMVQAYVSSREW